MERLGGGGESMHETELTSGHTFSPFAQLSGQFALGLLEGPLRHRLASAVITTATSEPRTLVLSLETQGA